MKLDRKEIATDEFKHRADVFRSWVTPDNMSPFPWPRAVYISLACPWASRTFIVHKLKRLEPGHQKRTVRRPAPKCDRDSLRFHRRVRGSDSVRAEMDSWTLRLFRVMKNDAHCVPMTRTEAADAMS